MYSGVKAALVLYLLWHNASRPSATRDACLREKEDDLAFWPLSTKRRHCLVRLAVESKRTHSQLLEHSPRTAVRLVYPPSQCSSLLFYPGTVLTFECTWPLLYVTTTMLYCSLTRQHEALAEPLDFCQTNIFLFLIYNVKNDGARQVTALQIFLCMQVWVSVNITTLRLASVNLSKRVITLRL